MSSAGASSPGLSGLEGYPSASTPRHTSRDRARVSPHSPIRLLPSICGYKRLRLGDAEDVCLPRMFARVPIPVTTLAPYLFPSQTPEKNGHISPLVPNSPLEEQTFFWVTFDLLGYRHCDRERGLLPKVWQQGPERGLIGSVQILEVTGRGSPDTRDSTWETSLWAHAIWVPGCITPIAHHPHTNKGHTGIGPLCPPYPQKITGAEAGRPAKGAPGKGRWTVRPELASRI